MSRLLNLFETEDLEERIIGRFRLPGPWPGRDLTTKSHLIRLSGGASRPGIAGLPGPGEFAPSVPRSSYQWLFFDTLSGTLPAGVATFDFDGPPIPFVGAITEVDVIASDPGVTWQMQISVQGQGPIFRTSQPLESLDAEGFFKPTPPGFWPETEGLVFALPASGLMPHLRFTRDTDLEVNLTVRVLIVAHPSF